LIALREGDAIGSADVASLREGLRELGWVEGRNLVIDIRWTGEPDQLPTLAAELLAAHPDVVLVRATPAVSAVLQHSRTVPIVFTQVTDPVSVGFVASLAQPGGTVTGFSNYEFSVAGKWLGMLKEIAPNVSRVAYMFNPVTAPYSGMFLDVMHAAAAQLAVDVFPTRVKDDEDIEAAMDALGRETNAGLVVGPDSFLVGHRKPILEGAARYSLPAIYPNLSFATDGGLIAYAVDTKDIYRRAALYVDRIFRGTAPADLPVQQPTRFEMIVNLKTAKALGLTMPPGLLIAADQVIE
jgi:putative ABC transport system substrate-binding protein